MKKEAAQTLEIETQNRSSAFDLGSINIEKGIVPAVFATDTHVKRWHSKVGDFWEELGFEAGMIRLERLNTSAPILDNHRRYESKLGTVESARVDGKTLVGLLRYDIGGEKGKEAFRQVVDKITKTVSVGYNVYEYRQIDMKGGLPVLMATDWEPYEVSDADIPADIRAGHKRTGEETTNKLTLILKTEKQMELNPKTPEELEQQRVAKEKADAILIEQGAEKERTRTMEIRSLCSGLDLPKDFVEKQIADKATVEAVRVAVLEQIKKKSDAVPPVRTAVVEATGQARAEAVEAVLLSRVDSVAFPLPKNIDNELQHVRLMDLCFDYLKANNLSTGGGNRQCVLRAMQFGAQQARSGTMTTSDFPNVFANVLRKTLRKDFKYTTGAWKPLTYKEDALLVGMPEKTIQLGDFDALEKVKESAEYKRTSIAEAAESFTAYKYGKEFGITYEMIVNDQIGLIERIARKATQLGVNTEDDIVWSLIQSNPVMADGVTVFHATKHKNLATGAALSGASLNELYQMIINQKGLNDRVINLTPKFLVYGNSLMYKVDQIFSDKYVPTDPTDVLPGYIKGLTPIHSPFIKDNSFYLFADPNTIETIRVGGVVGEPDFSVDEVMEIHTDQMIWHCRKFFGAAWTDYRGVAKNPGV